MGVLTLSSNAVRCADTALDGHIQQLGTLGCDRVFPQSLESTN
jgi:hypothetical protein